MPEDYYTSKLYPFQDRVLSAVQTAKTGFYLTGGTALSRVYLNHRYSDDLDMFINDAKDFREQVNHVVQCFKQNDLTFEIGARSDSFIRLHTEADDVQLKIDFVNDVPYHYGDIEWYDTYGNVDDWRNILSNKVCALSRLEAKDVADIMAVSMTYEFNWEQIINAAKEKDLWVEPLEVSKLVGDFPVKSFDSIKWIKKPVPSSAKKMLAQIQKDIFYGSDNSVFNFFNKHR